MVPTVQAVCAAASMCRMLFAAFQLSVSAFRKPQRKADEADVFVGYILDFPSETYPKVVKVAINTRLDTS